MSTKICKSVPPKFKHKNDDLIFVRICLSAKEQREAQVLERLLWAVEAVAPKLGWDSALHKAAVLECKELLAERGEELTHEAVMTMMAEGVDVSLPADEVGVAA